MIIINIVFISAGELMEYEDYENQILLGTEYQFFGLAKAFKRKELNVFIFRKWTDNNKILIDKINIINFKALNIKKSRVLISLSKLFFSFRVSFFINKIKPDVIIYVDPITSVFILRSSFPKLLVTHIMIPAIFVPEKLEKLCFKNLIFLKVNNIFQKYLFEKTNYIVSLNPDINNYYNTLGYNSVYIPNGIEISNYNPSNTQKPYILYGGRLVKEKRVNLLIKAYSLLSEDIKSKFNLLIVGDGPEKNNLNKCAIRCKISKNVAFIPFLPNKQFIECISNCKIFVLPSLYECMPVSLLEAMALNKPVIAINTMIDYSFRT